MSELDKLVRLRNIQSQINRIAPSYAEFNRQYDGPLGITITTPTGKSLTVELYDRKEPFRDHWNEWSLQHLDDLIKVLSVPALRDEFQEAVAKIWRKGHLAIEAAEQVGRARNENTKAIAQKRERYADHPLFQIEVERERLLERLNAEKLELCVELGLAERAANRRYQSMPDTREIERAYQFALESDTPKP